MHHLTIIGLGAGDLDQLSLGTYRKLKEAELIYRTNGSTSCCHGIKKRRNYYHKF